MLFGGPQELCGDFTSGGLDMLIFGTTSLKHVKAKGEFFCPACQDHQPYKLREPRRWFHLYWIPIIPMKSLGRYVECGTCKKTFVEEALERDPKAEAARIRADVGAALRWVGLKMCLADGEASEAELIEVAVMIKGLIDVDVTVDDLRRDVEGVRRDERAVEDYLKATAQGLSDRGKEAVMRGLLTIAFADDHLDETEKQFFARCGGALQMSRAHVLGLIVEAEESARRLPAPPKAQND